VPTELGQVNGALVELVSIVTNEIIPQTDNLEIFLKNPPACL
jgi:hypothetical protein